MNEQRKMVAFGFVAGRVFGYERTIVEPILADWACGRKFRKEDRHRLRILLGHIEAMTGAPVEVDRLAQALRGAL